MRERCEMTNKMKESFDNMFKEIVTLDGLKITDMIGADPKVMLMLGYATKMVDYSFDMLDDAYGFIDYQKKFNEKLLGELEELDRQLKYQDSLIRILSEKLDKDKESKTRSVKKTDED